MPYYIGIDIGTSGTRAIAIDEHRNVQAESSTALLAPLRKGKFIEQDPEVWWQATQRTLKDISRAVDPQQVKAIAVDATSSTLMVTNENGKAIYPAIMYNDNRAIEEAVKIKRYALKETAAIGASCALAKLLWLQKQGYAKRAAYALHQADWVTGQLCGRFGTTDVNNAMKLGYDAIHNEWPQWLKRLDTPMELLPKVVKPGTPVGTIEFKLTERFNFPINTQIIAGTTDSTASFIATGASEVGDAVTALGSTLVLKVLADKPVFDPIHGVYSQPLDNKWLVGGASNSGGAVLLKYFTLDQIEDLSNQMQPAHHTGLNYYPLLAPGERFPINDPELEPRLTPRPANNATFLQGMLEGIAAIEQRGYEVLNELGAPYPVRIYSTGGGAASHRFKMIRSLELNSILLKAKHTEAAYGSALLALQGSQQIELKAQQTFGHD